MAAPIGSPGLSITVYGAPLTEAKMTAIVEMAPSPIQGIPLHTEELGPDTDSITEEAMLYEPTEMTNSVACRFARRINNARRKF